MAKSIRQEILVSIFEKGIDNNAFFNRKEESIGGLKNLLKILRLVFYRISFGPKKQISQSSLLLVWYPLHEKVLSQHSGEEVVLLAQKNSLKGLSFISFVSLLKILKNIACIPHNMIRSGLSYDWFFYKTFYSFLEENKVESLTIAGHYDKYATWISYLARDMDIYLTISQHGANSKYSLPHKIPANRVETFSLAEEGLFKSTILFPENTEFYIKGFKSSLVFLEGKFDRRAVAIASQPGYEDKVSMIIDTLRSFDPEMEIIVYSHPADKFRRGNLCIDKKYRCKMVHNERYWDIDFLIVFTSTLAYDYWSCKSFQGFVICYYDKNCLVALYDDERSIIIYPDTYKTQLKEILQKK